MTTVSDPKIVPELRPFVKRVGELSEAAVNLPELSLARFAQEQPVPIPGLSPVQEALGQRAIQRTVSPPFPPFPEQLALGIAGTLPVLAGQEVPVSGRLPEAVRTSQQGLEALANIQHALAPFTTGGLQTLGKFAETGPGLPELANIQHALAPFTTEGLQTLGKFAETGPGSISPALQQAVTGLQEEIVPAVQNQAARAGLAQSGFLPNEIARAYARELVPLFQQGLAQQQQAAQALLQPPFSQVLPLQMQGLAQQQQAAQALLQPPFSQVLPLQMQAAERLRDTQLALGQTEQALATDARLRELQAAQFSVPQLLQLGQQESQRDVAATEEARQFGELQRQVELQRSQTAMDAFGRQRELAMGLVNPFGSFATFGGGGTQITSPRGGLAGLLKG